MIEQQLQQLLSVFQLNRAELESAGDAADLATCAKALAHDCQKVSLLVIHQQLPPWSSKDGEALLKHYVGLCFALGRHCALRSVGGCKAFTAATRDSFQSVVDASCAFFGVVCGTAAAVQPSKDVVLAATAAVMEKCKLLEAMPKDNRTATSRYLIRIGSAIKDVVRELGDMKAKEPGAEGDGEDDEARYISLLDRVTISRELSALGDAPYWHQTSSPPPQMGEGDDGDSDFDFNPDFDEAEAHIAELAIPLASAALQLLKPAMRALMDSSEPGDTEGLGRLDALSTVYKQIAIAVEEVGASLYPPQEIESLRTHCSAIASGAGAFAQLMAEMPGVAADTRVAVQQAAEEVLRAKEGFAGALTGSCAEAA